MDAHLSEEEFEMYCGTHMLPVTRKFNEFLDKYLLVGDYEELDNLSTQKIVVQLLDRRFVSRKNNFHSCMVIGVAHAKWNNPKSKDERITFKVLIFRKNGVRLENSEEYKKEYYLYELGGYGDGLK